MPTPFPQRQTFSAEAIARRDFLRAGLLVASGATLAAAKPPVAAPDGVPALGGAAQLFVDDAMIERLENVQRLFHRAEKHPANPVLGKEKPWESLNGTWGTVLYDAQEQIFKAWYGGQGRSTGINKPGFQRTRNILCYATSADGMHWDRPELGLHTVMGSKRSNVVVRDDHHEGMDHWESVLKDPMDPDPRRRYKAIGWSSYDWEGPLSGIYTMTSPDGLHWTHTPEPVLHYSEHVDRRATDPRGRSAGDLLSLTCDPAWPLRRQGRHRQPVSRRTFAFSVH